MCALQPSAAFKNTKSHKRNLGFLLNNFTAHKISTTQNSMVEEESPIRVITNVVT